MHSALVRMHWALLRLSHCLAMQAVVSPRVLMLCKAAKKCGWALEVVPFWELMQ